MGRRGRSGVCEATSIQDLQTFSGKPFLCNAWKIIQDHFLYWSLIVEFHYPLRWRPWLESWTSTVGTAIQWSNPIILNFKCAPTHKLWRVNCRSVWLWNCGGIIYFLTEAPVSSFFGCVWRRCCVLICWFVSFTSHWSVRNVGDCTLECFSESQREWGAKNCRDPLLDPGVDCWSRKPNLSKALWTAEIRRISN